MRESDPRRQAQDTGRPPLSDAEYAKKKETLERARADRAPRGEPTSGLPGDADSRRAEGFLPPRGQTDQTR